MLIVLAAVTSTVIPKPAAPLLVRSPRAAIGSQLSSTRDDGTAVLQKAVGRSCRIPIFKPALLVSRLLLSALNSLGVVDRLSALSTGCATAF